MPLDGRSVVDFLLEHGVLEPEDVLDRALKVTELPRRNSCFAVHRGDVPGLFVKEAATDDAGNRATLRAEAALAGAAAGGGDFAPVATLGAPLRLFDEERGVLVVDLVEGGEELQRRARRDGGVAPPVARALGAAVGVLHRDVPAFAAGGPPAREPWVLSLGGFGDESLAGEPRAVLDLRDVARDLPELADGLRELREAWHHDAFLHGDLKWDNVLVAGGESDPRVHLVDWEMSGPGDPAWDVGGLLHSYVRHWVCGLPQEAILDGAADPDGTPPAAAGPSVAALWDGYRSEAGPAADAALLERAVRCAGARLLQTAFESVTASARLSARAVGLAQVAANVLAQPRPAARALLGLDLGG